MSQEHDNTSADTQVLTDIHPEPAPFEPGYQPGTLPQLSVPDLADDAEGLSAAALANVPTLTALVESDFSPVVSTVQESAHVLEPTDDLPVQAEPTQADTWGEQLYARMGRLTDDIHTLNVRLDRLEERKKTKV
jgi:hypothetical protein